MNDIEKLNIDVAVDTLYSHASVVIEEARQTAYRQINDSLVRRNWRLGQLIAEEELKGEGRAKYGLDVIKKLAKRLTTKYGKGFTKTNLYSFTQFYKLFPEIFHTLCGKSETILSRSHYRTLIQELNPDARQWYEQEAATQGWSVRTIQRYISSQYFFRLVSSQKKELVKKEMLKLTAPLQSKDPAEFIKNPVIGEFLGFTADSSFRESDLEQSIIDYLEIYQVFFEDYQIA